MRGTDVTKKLVMTVMPSAIRSFDSDPGISCLLPAPMKLWQPNLLTDKQCKISDPSWFLTTPYSWINPVHTYVPFCGLKSSVSYWVGAYNAAITSIWITALQIWPEHCSNHLHARTAGNNHTQATTLSSVLLWGILSLIFEDCYKNHQCHYQWLPYTGLSEIFYYKMVRRQLHFPHVGSSIYVSQQVAWPWSYYISIWPYNYIGLLLLDKHPRLAGSWQRWVQVKPT